MKITSNVSDKKGEPFISRKAKYNLLIKLNAGGDLTYLRKIRVKICREK